MISIDSTWQVVFIDALFLCLATGLALWFRSWLTEQQRGMDARLDALEEQQRALARICERLTSACRGLERPSPAVDAIPRSTTRPERATPPQAEAPAPADTAPQVAVQPAAVEKAARRPEAEPIKAVAAAKRRIDTPAARADRQWEEQTDRSREAYRKARALLEQGVPPNDIARQVGLGVAEINVLKRMRDAGRP